MLQSADYYPCSWDGRDDLTCFSAATIRSPAVHAHCNNLFNQVCRDAVGCEPQWLTQLILLCCSRNCRWDMSCHCKTRQGTVTRAQQGSAGLSQRQLLISAITLMSSSNQKCQCYKENWQDQSHSRDRPSHVWLNVPSRQLLGSSVELQGIIWQ